jgi:hypothetical protein
MKNIIHKNILSTLSIVFIVGVIAVCINYSYTPDPTSLKNQNAEAINSKSESGIYKIENGTIVSSIQVKSEEQKTWEIFTKYTPKFYLDQITLLEVTYINSDMTLVNIEKIELGSNQNVFKLKINIEKLKTLSESNQIEETRVLPIFIHEIAHQISLQSDQLEPNTYTNQSLSKNEYIKDFKQKQAQCNDTYYLKEGCSTTESHINKFYQKFWTSNWSEYQEIQAIEVDDEFYQKSLKFYENHKDEFVSKEAFFSPEEDFAESFRVFVLGDKSKLSGVARQKVEFFEGIGDWSDFRKI